jgi:hypothetical protein
MNLMTTIAALGLAGVTLAWLSTRQRLTRPPSWRQARRAGSGRSDSGWLCGATRWLRLHDSLTFGLRWSLRRAQKLADRLAGPAAAMETAFAELRLSLIRVQEAYLGLADTPPTLAPATAGRLMGALFAGDIAVVAGILMADNAQLPLLLAAITSLAIATMQFGLGKLLGKIYIERVGKAAGRSEQLLAAAPLIALATAGLSLGLLVLGAAFAWVFLAVAPAIGAAALTVVSHEPTYQRLYRAERAIRRPRRRCNRTMAKLGRALGRASGAFTWAASLAIRRFRATERALAVADGTLKPMGNLTMEVASIQTTLTELGAIKLEILDHTRNRLDERLQEMHALAGGSRPGGDTDPAKTNGHNRAKRTRGTTTKAITLGHDGKEQA